MKMKRWKQPRRRDQESRERVKRMGRRAAVDGVEVGKIEEAKEKLETEKMEVDGDGGVNNIPEKNSKENDGEEKKISEVGTGELNGEGGVEAGTKNGDDGAEVVNEEWWWGSGDRNGEW